MIRIFSHYVSVRLVFLACLDAIILTLAAYVGVTFAAGGTVQAIAGHGVLVPPLAAAFALMVPIVMTSMGLYQAHLWENARSILGRVTAAVVLIAVMIFFASSLIPSSYLGSGALAIIVAASITGSVLIRFAYQKIGGLAALKPRVLVLGTGSRVMKLAEFARHSNNYHVVGYLPQQSKQATQHYVPLENILPVNPGDTLLSLVEKHKIDQIVLAVRDRRDGGLPLRELLECRLKGVKITELTTFFEREYRQVLLESLNPSWMVLGEGFRQGFFRAAMKRLFDLMISGALLLIALPAILVAAFFIFIESGLPIFYRQQRTGECGRVFTLYKLRSMKNDAESGGSPRWAAANDDRVTRVGRMIRKLRIDELPQIVNVFRGEMSFVGPRPERPFFVDQLVKQIPYYSLRHCVKPGITGWAQVRYAYGASLDDTVEKLQYDLYYVKNHRLFLDLVILIATLEVVLWGRGAR